MPRRRFGPGEQGQPATAGERGQGHQGDLRMQRALLAGDRAAGAGAWRDAAALSERPLAVAGFPRGDGSLPVGGAID